MVDKPTKEDIAYFIFSCQILDTNYEIVEKIKSKWKIDVSYSQVQRFRRSLPKMQKRRLERSRQELLAIYLYIINELKCSIEKLNDSTDTEIRIKMTKELRKCAMQYHKLLKDEIIAIERRGPF